MSILAKLLYKLEVNMGYIDEVDPMVPSTLLTSSVQGHPEPESLTAKRAKAIAYLRSRNLYVLDRSGVVSHEHDTILGTHRARSSHN